jgi:hypothetical protein
VLNPALIEMYAREQQRDLALAAAAEAQMTSGADARPRRGLAGLLAAMRGRRLAKPMPQVTMQPAAAASVPR